MRSVILLPGLGCDADVWQAQLPPLATRHLVHVSDVHFRDSTLPAMAARLLAEVAGRLVLVGASMGGMLALEVQRQAPGRVSALALLGTSARADTPELIRLRNQACELFAAGRVDDVLHANAMFAFHPNSQRNRALVDDYRRMIASAGAEQLMRQNRAVMARIDSRPLLPLLRCPVLVMCGEADLLTPPEHAREIAAAIPDARLDVLPGAGHMLTLEQPARVNSVLMNWLQALPAD